MVKTIKLICLAGILALIVIFILFTDDGRSPNQKKINDKAYNEQAIKTDKAKKSVYVPDRIKSGANVESEIINLIIPW